MEDALKVLNSKLNKETHRYRDLLECLERERQALINADMTVVRETSETKVALATGLMEGRQGLEAAWSDVFPDSAADVSISHIDKTLPESDSSPYSPVRKALLDLDSTKNQVRDLAGINKAIAEDCLGFLNDMFTSITMGEPEKAPAYGKDGQVQKRPDSNRFMDQEV